MRATGHGISAGIGKLGAFIGVFLFPVLQTSLGLRDTLLLTAGVSVLGFALTLVLPEPARRSLEDITVSTPARPPGPCGWPISHQPPDIPISPMLTQCHVVQRDHDDEAAMVVAWRLPDWLL